MEKTYLTSKSSMYANTPKSRLNIIDSSAQVSSRRKEVENTYEPLDFGTSSLENKEKHLETRFKSLIDRCAKSREYLDNLHKTASITEKSSLTSTIVSPKSNSNFNSRSGLPPFETTKRTLFSTVEANNGWNKENTRRKENEPQDFNRLEEDLMDLKNEIIDKYQKSPKKQGLDNYSFNSSDSDNNKEPVNYQSTKPISNKEKNKIVVQGGSIYNKNVLSRKSLTKYSTNKPSKTREEDDYTNALVEENLEKEHKKTSNSINKLKSVMKQKEKMEYEKYLTLKAKTKEFKNILREYVNKVIDLEDNIRNKDHIIIESEEQLKENQQELLKNFDMLQDLRRKNEEHRKMEDEIKNANIEYKVKLNEQRKKLDKIEDSVTLNEEKLRAEIDELRQDNALMRRDLNISREREVQCAESNENFNRQVQELQDELNSKAVFISKLEECEVMKERENKELKDELEKYLIENKHLSARFEDVKSQIAQLEERNSKTKKKFGEEKDRFLDEFQKKIGSKSEKNKSLKQMVKDLEKSLNAANDEKKGITVDKDKIISIKVQNEKEINKLSEDLSLANHEM